MQYPLIVLSNRGPLSWSCVNDALVSRRGAGGLVSALGPGLTATGGTWIAAAQSESDRRAAKEGQQDNGPYQVRLLTLDAAEQEQALHEISNRILWFAHHDLWNRPYGPVFDAKTHAAWSSYRKVNKLFAAAAIKEARHLQSTSSSARLPVVLVQDYHLALVPKLLKQLAPEIPVGHFSHTPFAHTSAFSVLPSDWRQELAEGMGAADLCSFHTQRWAARFRAILQQEAPDLTPGIAPKIEVHPLSPDPKSLQVAADSPKVRAERAILEKHLKGRRAVVRVDRAELSKNIIRGIDSYTELMRRRPDLLSSTAHLILVNPSRLTLKEYREYLHHCRQTAEKANDELGEEIIIFLEDDNFPRSLAAFLLADVFIVNPISDGMNLVAKEGPLLNEKNAPVVLSTEAGAYEELAEMCLGVNPYDITATAKAIEIALEMPENERERRAQALRHQAMAHPPGQWLTAQLEGLQ